ncbi:MAG: hypothetical protein ACR2QM_13580, partial [Longimicrobiales bacterium]
MRRDLISRNTGTLTLIACAALTGCAAPDSSSEPARDIQVAVTFPSSLAPEALDGRLLVALSTNPEGDPLGHVSDGIGAQPVFGIDVEGWAPGTPSILADSVFGFPVRRLGDLPPGQYRAQAILNRYETFTRSDGHTVKLPPDRGEGQQWRSKPGNLTSVPMDVTISDTGPTQIELELTEQIAELPDPETLQTEWVK